ncbi:hypothetical protein [Halobacillus sp. H74]|uniref:hypothetical protein n=1 Tax=Halobacillus sp. H74 TaxID=3457436 RepID=UPI003FCE49D5
MKKIGIEADFKYTYAALQAKVIKFNKLNNQDGCSKLICCAISGQDRDGVGFNVRWLWGRLEKQQIKCAMK